MNIDANAKSKLFLIIFFIVAANTTILKKVHKKEELAVETKIVQLKVPANTI